MNVLHYLEQVECEANMYSWAIYELVKCIIVEFLNEMAQKNIVLVHRVVVPRLEIVLLDVEKLVLLLARAFHVLTLGDM
jgi:hypothetical protein